MGRLLSLCVATVLLAACASDESRHEQEMNHLVGKADKAFFVSKYGPPDKRVMIGDGVELWEYRLLGEPIFAPQNAYRFSNFDRLRLTFTRGVLSAWSHAGVTE